MPRTTCQKCGGSLPVQNGRHQPRKFCTRCRPPRNRSTKPASQVVTSIRRGQAAPPSTLVEATARQLAEVGRLDHPDGVLVLNLARSIDGGGHSGASLAALSREFTRMKATALAADPGAAEDDGIDWGVG